MTSEKKKHCKFFFDTILQAFQDKIFCYYSVIKRTLNDKISKAKKTRFNWPSGQSWTLVKFVKF